MKPSDSGMTLVEVMTAVLILGIAISAVFFSVSATHFSVAQAKHRAQAANLIQQRLEQLKRDGLTAIPTGDAAVTADFPFQVSDTDVVMEDGLTGSLVTQVEPIVAGPNGYVEVTVTCQWDERTSGSALIETQERMTTYVAR